MKSNHATQITASVLGMYAGLLGIEHGIFEVLQGNVSPTGLLINAIGPPCQPKNIWHACFPALTLIPNFLITGIVAILVGLVMTIWAARLVGHSRGGQILILLSIGLLLVGGGFVPMFIGIFAGFAGIYLSNPLQWKWLSTLKPLWPWTLVLLIIWLPGSWLLGNFFGAQMLAFGPILFLVWDIGLPVLCVLAGFGHQQAATTPK